MQSKVYRKYIRSAEWQEVKRQRMEIDGGKCCMCGRPADTCKNGLQVHHITYERLTHENVLTDVCTLCPACHKKMHNFLKRRTQ